MAEPKDDLAAREKELDKRFFVVEIDTETGELDWDDVNFAPWELIGIAAAIDRYARDLIGEDD